MLIVFQTLQIPDNMQDLLGNGLLCSLWQVLRLRKSLETVGFEVLKELFFALKSPNIWMAFQAVDLLFVVDLLQ